MPLDADTRKIYGLTGGRHLDAIRFNKNLDKFDKMVLHELAAEMDVQGDYAEARWIYIARLVETTGMSRRQIFTVLARLEERGYITRQKQRATDGSRNLATLFRFTSKLFNEFAAQHNVRPLRRPAVGA